MRLFLGLALSVLFLGGQDIPAPVFRTTTRLVQVNVVVHDHNGPVGDLKKEEKASSNRSPSSAWNRSTSFPRRPSSYLRTSSQINWRSVTESHRALR